MTESSRQGATVAIRPFTTVITASRIWPPRPSRRRPARRVTGSGLDWQEVPAMLTDAQKTRSARVAGRFLAHAATTVNLKFVVASREALPQGQLTQGRLFPDRRGNELFLHTAS